MININPVISDDKKSLTIKIDLTQKGHESKSGKSHVIASTQGNVPVGNNGLRLGINLYQLKPTA